MTKPKYKLYITYGNGTNLRNNYSVIEGESYSECRQIADEVTGGKFAFDYPEIAFAGQAEKYNLTEVPLQPQVYL